jgi:dipeptidyl-peptidase 4
MNCPVRPLVVLSLLVLAGIPNCLDAAPPLAELRTPCEQSEFKRYTSHDEMLQYLLDLRAASTDMRIGYFGETRQRRRLPYAILSRPLVSQPHEALLLQRPVVVLAMNVHGGERTLRESLLILLRKLADPESPLHGLLEQMVIVAVPQLNPDGAEATSAGTRGNAWGIDLNRDYMKLEHPSIAAFVANVVNRWHPHLVVDGHNGGTHPYNLQYLAPSHAACDPRIAQWCDEELFPHIDRRMKEKGYASFYYSKGNEERWTVGGFEPRIGRNYLGFMNCFGILFESPSRQDMQTGVDSGLVALQAVLEYVAEHPQKVMDTVRNARLETLQQALRPAGNVVVQMRYEAEDRTVAYQIEVGEGEERQLKTVPEGKLIKKPVPTAVRPQPYAYLLPREAVAAVDLLRRHQIAVEVLERDIELEVQAYPLLEVHYVRVFNHPAAVRVKADEPVTIKRTFPEGTYVVPAGQTAGRVLTHLLEPETTDSVFFWNLMDPWLPKAALIESQKKEPKEPVLIPVFKLMQPTALPSVLD